MARHIMIYIYNVNNTCIHHYMYLQSILHANTDVWEMFLFTFSFFSQVIYNLYYICLPVYHTCRQKLDFVNVMCFQISLQFTAQHFLSCQLHLLCCYVINTTTPLWQCESKSKNQRRPSMTLLSGDYISKEQLYMLKFYTWNLHLLVVKFFNFCNNGGVHALLILPYIFIVKSHFNIMKTDTFTSFSACWVILV